MSKNPDRLITLHIADMNCVYLTEYKHTSTADALLDVETEGSYPVGAFTPKEAKKLGQALIDFAKGKLDTRDSVAEAEIPEEDDE